MGKRILSFILILLIVIFPTGNASAVGKAKKPVPPPKIVSVKDVSITVDQGENIKIPATVKATYDNKKVSNVSVKWKVSKIDTSKPGNYSYEGTVKGYAKKVFLKVFIKKKDIASEPPAEPETPKEMPKPAISSIEGLAKEVNVNDNLELPKTVPAKMSDGTSLDVPVLWETQTVSTTAAGIQIIKGSVDGFASGVILELTVKGNSEPVKEYREAQVGDIVGIAGQIMGYTYEHYGIYIGNDTVIHYTSPTGKYADGQIMEGKMSERFPKGKYFVLNLGNAAKYTADETVERAKSRLGEKKYDLFTNNCEHFAVWCKSGVSKSYQIDRLAPDQVQLLKTVLEATGISLD